MVEMECKEEIWKVKRGRAAKCLGWILGMGVDVKRVERGQNKTLEDGVH